MTLEEKANAATRPNVPQNQHGSPQLAAQLGAEVCGVNLGSTPSALTAYNAVVEHLSRWEQRHGKDASVFMKKEICFDARDGKISMREFRVLAAIYSVIGRKPFALIRGDMIQARAHGCKSPGIFTIESELIPQEARLTPKQVRSTVEKLHELRFFARVTPQQHGRKTFYSHRLSGDQLREHIFKKQTRGTAFRREERDKDAKLSERILAEKQKGHFKKKGTLKSETNPKGIGADIPGDEYNEGSAEASEGHQKGTAMGTFNTNPFNSNTLNRNPLNEPVSEENRVQNSTGKIARLEQKPSVAIENGRLFQGRFFNTAEINKLFADNANNPDWIKKLLTEAKPARRVDGELIDALP